MPKTQWIERRLPMRHSWDCHATWGSITMKKRAPNLSSKQYRASGRRVALVFPFCLALLGINGAALAQKGPAPAPAPERTETFVTNPGGSVGGLLFADIDDLVLLAAEKGAATVERDDDGARYVAAKMDGLNYVIDVYNCDPDCADLTLTASFTLDGITVERINEWNQTRRFRKAYIGSDGDAVIQFAINTRHGITVETFRDDLVWWETVLPEYAEFIGFR